MLLSAVVVTGGLAFVAPSPASAAVCGAHVTYGSWRWIDGNTWKRTWTWTYKNCSIYDVRRKVIVNNGPDSVCHLIKIQSTGTHVGHESQTAGFHTNEYEKTVSC